MKWLLSRMVYELEEKNYFEKDKIIEKYAKMAKIQARIKYGEVYTIEDFIEEVKSGGFTPYDGVGYYWDKVKNEETCGISFNVDVLKRESKKYKYVIWYNR